MSLEKSAKIDQSLEERTRTGKVVWEQSAKGSFVGWDMMLWMQKTLCPGDVALSSADVATTNLLGARFDRNHGRFLVR
jgi:hypothetical protein